MSDDDVPVIKSRLTLSLGASVSVQTGVDFSDWVKPSCSYSIDFKGIPSEEQLSLAAHFIQEHVLAPVLESTIIEAQKRLEDARKNR